MDKVDRVARGLRIASIALCLFLVATWIARADGGGVLSCTGGCYGSGDTCSRVACGGKPCTKVSADVCGYVAYMCCTVAETTPTPTRTSAPTATRTATAAPSATGTSSAGTVTATSTAIATTAPSATPTSVPSATAIATSEPAPVASPGIYDVRDYGAICDGASHVGADGREADWRGIQEALNAAQAGGGGIVELGRGVCLTDRPLVIPFSDAWGRAGITLRGAGGGYVSIIRKTTNQVGDFERQASNGRTDSFRVDAIVMVDHPDGTINRHISIEGLMLESGAPQPVAVGIYAPRMSYSGIEDVRVNGCDSAYFGYQLVLSHIERLYAEGPGAGRGVGFRLADDGSHANSSTSLSMDTVYMQRFRYGFHLYRLFYSSLNALAMDHSGEPGAVGVAYHLENSQGVVLNGLGAEDVRGVTLNLNDSWAAVNGFYGWNLRGYSADYATLQIKGGHTALTACYWTALVEANGQRNTTMWDGYTMTQTACTMPSGGQ